MYSFGGGTCRVFVEATVHFVTPGTIMLPDHPHIRAPLLSLQYDLEVLGPVSAILGSMHKREEEPDVYVWDEHLPEPEVAIVFRTENPDRAVLDDVAGKLGHVLNDTAVEMGCQTLWTMAEVNLSKSGVDTMTRLFEETKFICVEVCETGLPMRDEQSLRKFVTPNLYRRNPHRELSRLLLS